MPAHSGRETQQDPEYVWVDDPEALWVFYEVLLGKQQPQLWVSDAGLLHADCLASCQCAGVQRMSAYRLHPFLYAKVALQDCCCAMHNIE